MIELIWNEGLQLLTACTVAVLGVLLVRTPLRRWLGAEMAYLADPDDRSIHGIRAAVYEARRKVETSFMATGIYRAAVLDSKDRLG